MERYLHHKEFLMDQNCKQSDMTKQMHNQWLEMEKMKLKHEQERERERAHEIRLFEMFTTMVHGSQPPPLENQHYPTSGGTSSPIYADLQNASGSNSYCPPFNFR